MFSKWRLKLRSSDCADAPNCDAVEIASSYDCAEPRHMHADRENRSAKFWLDPDASLATNHGYSRRELRDIERIARENLELLRNEWDQFCGGYISSSLERHGYGRHAFG